LHQLANQRSSTEVIAPTALGRCVVMGSAVFGGKTMPPKKSEVKTCVARSVSNGLAESAPSQSRREFLTTAAALTIGSGASASLAPLVPAQRPSGHAETSPAAGLVRQTAAWQIRAEAARLERNRPLADHPSNGDEERYPNKIGTYTKGLPHNSLGEVDLGAFASLSRALRSGDPADFDDIVVSGISRLVNPQAGLAFAMQGPDSHSLTMRPAPAFSSAEEASEIAENYWMALTRDVSFSEYSTHALIQQAASDLSRFSDFHGPSDRGRITSSTLFRERSGGSLNGPYVSQFLWQAAPFGSESVERRMSTPVANVDYMTTYPDWLSIQNGAAAGPNIFDPAPRYIRNGRDLGEWVHHDVLFQAYFDALLILFRLGAQLDSGNPYRSSRNQIGFGTLGDPYIASVLCAVAREALKAVWYQKWFVHRRLRPEAFGGRIHSHLTGAAHYPIHSDILNSAALTEVYRRNHTYLLPLAFPEGSPLHPAYGAGHATVAGACVTVLKAFFDESFIIPSPVEVTADGLALTPYSGPDLTVGGELNKLAVNVALGRNFAGVHWRSDATESLNLGEELAIRYLAEERSCFNERFGGYSLTRFDGSMIIV
jgi:hypothetical protein